MAQQTALTIPQQLGRMDAGRLRAYAELLSFYQGDQWPRQMRRRERRLIFNYAKAFVDKTTSYLMSSMHAVVDAEDDSPEAAERALRTERALREISEQNNLAQLDFDTELDAAVLGDGAFKVTWDSVERRVRVSAPDVQGLFVWWLGDDVTRVWRVASRYFMSADEVEIAFGVRPSAQRPDRVEVVEVWTAETFDLWIDGKVADEKANPYGFIPFVIYPNLREPVSDTLSTALRRMSAAGCHSMWNSVLLDSRMRSTRSVRACLQPSQLISFQSRFATASRTGVTSGVGPASGSEVSSDCSCSIARASSDSSWR